MEKHRDADAEVARLASRQYGYITTGQARAAGLTLSQVRYRRGTRRWESSAGSVSRLPGGSPSWRADTMLACLAAGGPALASHRSAAALHRLLDPPATPQIVVLATANGRSAGGVTHRMHLDPAERAMVDGIPVTRIGRTLIDLGSMLDRKGLAGVVDHALTARMITVVEVQQSLDRLGFRPGTAGAPLLREVLQPWLRGLRPESVGEARLLRRLAEWYLPEPVTQFEVKRPDGSLVARVDLAWPCQMVALEYDGRQFHGPRAWTRDEQRAAELKRLGWTLLTAHASDLQPGECRLLKRLQNLLLVPAHA